MCKKCNEPKPCHNPSKYAEAHADGLDGSCVVTVPDGAVVPFVGECNPHSSISWTDSGAARLDEKGTYLVEYSIHGASCQKCPVTVALYTSEFPTKCDGSCDYEAEPSDPEKVPCSEASSKSCRRTIKNNVIVKVPSNCTQLELLNISGECVKLDATPASLTITKLSSCVR